MSDISSFMKQVLAVNPPYDDVMANGIPGMAVNNSGANAVNTMRASAADFAKSYGDKLISDDRIQQLADRFEADARVVATLQPASQRQIDDVVDALHELLQERTQVVNN
jgi:hypothetical protein